MIKTYLLFGCSIIFLQLEMMAQNNSPANNPAAIAWADSVFKTLSPDEQIAQLMVVRLSAYNAKNNTAIFYDDKVGQPGKTIQYRRGFVFSRVAR